MNKALQLLKVKPRDFPLRITVASGEIHHLTLPRHLGMRPDGKHIVLFPANGFLEIITAEDVVSIKRRAPRFRAVFR